MPLIAKTVPCYPSPGCYQSLDLFLFTSVTEIIIYYEIQTCKTVLKYIIFV